MSDSMTNAEIEDILTSIRRLVSEDTRTVPQPAPPLSSGRAGRASGGAGRLVLTPALRVASSRDEAEAEAAAEAEAGPAVETPDAGAPDEGGRVEAEAIAPEAADGGDAEGDASAEPEIALDDGARQDDGAQEDGAQEAEAEAADAPEAADTPEAAAADDEARAPQDVQAQDDVDAAPAMPEDAGAPPVSAEPEGDPAQPEATPTEFFAAPDALARPSAGDDAEGSAAARLGRIGATIAGLEAAVAARQEEWDPDGSERTGSHVPPFMSTRLHQTRAAPQRAGRDADERDADEDEVLPWQDDVPEETPASRAQTTTRDSASRRAGPGDGGESGVSDDRLFDGDDETSILDEETLHELVRDIIREELQGTLGERITRNVRKLVRAEIGRALAARDFD